MRVVVEPADADSKLLLCSVCTVLGIEFHLKYVVKFGLPSVFAFADGMQPLPLPICVSRYFSRPPSHTLSPDVIIPSSANGTVCLS